MKTQRAQKYAVILRLKYIIKIELLNAKHLNKKGILYLEFIKDEFNKLQFVLKCLLEDVFYII